MRIRGYIIEGISYPEIGEYPRTTIQEYQAAWDYALRNKEDPSMAIAAILYDKIGCTSTYQSGATSFKSPVFLGLLSLTIASFGGPWWKLVTQKFKLFFPKKSSCHFLMETNEPHQPENLKKSSRNQVCETGHRRQGRPEPFQGETES